MIDSEGQLAEKVVDEEVMGELQRTGYMTTQHMTLIDSVLTMPGTTVETELLQATSEDQKKVREVNTQCLADLDGQDCTSLSGLETERHEDNVTMGMALRPIRSRP